MICRTTARGYFAARQVAILQRNISRADRRHEPTEDIEHAEIAVGDARGMVSCRVRPRCRANRTFAGHSRHRNGPAVEHHERNVRTPRAEFRIRPNHSSSSVSTAVGAFPQPDREIKRAGNASLKKSLAYLRPCESLTPPVVPQSSTWLMISHGIFQDRRPSGGAPTAQLARTSPLGCCRGRFVPNRRETAKGPASMIENRSNTRLVLLTACQHQCYIHLQIAVVAAIRRKDDSAR